MTTTKPSTTHERRAAAFRQLGATAETADHLAEQYGRARQQGEKRSPAAWGAEVKAQRPALFPIGAPATGPRSMVQARLEEAARAAFVRGTTRRDEIGRMSRAEFQEHLSKLGLNRTGS